MDADGGSADGPPTSAGDGENDEDGDGERCTICLCGGDSGELLQRGCCCRGAGGLVHLECITQLAIHRYTQDGRDWGVWHSCGTCKGDFTGGVWLGLGVLRHSY